MKRIHDLRSRPIGTVSVAHDSTIAEALEAFLRHGVSGLVVYEGDQLAGIFTKNDLVRCCYECPAGHRDVTVADYMTRDLYTVDVDTDLDDIAKRMIEGDFRHVPVLEKGRVIGMVTPIDILFYQKGHLAEERDDLLRYIQGMY